jgi:NAD-dependent histone deacetylase SIR2
MPPIKRRKVAEIKPRTTKYIDLQSPSHRLLTDQNAELALLLKVLRKRRKIVVIAGAGISVSAGSMGKNSTP